jgi:hypothetical protein
MANRRSIERAVSVHYAAAAAASSTGGGATAGAGPMGRGSLDAGDLRGSNRRRFSFSEAASQMLGGPGRSSRMLDQAGSTPGALQALMQQASDFEDQGLGHPGVTRGLSGLGDEGVRNSAASTQAGGLPTPSGSQVPSPFTEGQSIPQMEELGFGSAISVWPRKTTGEVGGQHHGLVCTLSNTSWHKRPK